MLDQFINRLNQLSESWATWMGASLIETAVVMALLGLIWLAIRKRTSPRLGYLLFLLIPIRLLIPLEVHVPGLPVAWASPASSQTEVQSEYISPVAIAPVHHAVADPIVEMTPVQSGSERTALAETATRSPISHIATSGWLLLAWMTGVVFLLGRLIIAQFRLASLVRRSRAIDPAVFAIDLEQLCRTIGVGKVRMFESDTIDSPAVCGIIRPKIVVPAGVLESLSVKQREWILLHELGHVRRRDLLVNCFQRLIAIVHFPNPAMWVANSQINRLREYACDDLASTLSEASEVDSSEAFLSVVKHASSRRRQPLYSCAAALGMSRSSSQSACRRRISRLLDSDVTRTAKLGWKSLVVLLLAALVSLPQLRAAEQSENELSGVNASTVNTTQKDPSARTQKTADTNETIPFDPEPIHLTVIVAKNVLLLEGKEIITWEQLEKKISTDPDPSRYYPHFYITRGATEAGLYEPTKEKIWNLHKDNKLKGHSEGSMWPRTDFRYDRIKTPDDLKPDPALLMTGTVTAKDKPVAGAEVVLITPVDESISYRSYHLALVEGRIRNRMEHVMTVTDENGKYELYPPQDTPYYVLVVHPKAGFAMYDNNRFATETKIPMMDWAGIVTKLEDPKNEQHADLSTTIDEYDGKPEVVINQYWSDLKQKEKTRTFRFLRIPPLRKTSISRSFPSPDGGSTSIPAATVNLLPGEIRSIDFGEISQAQLDWLKMIRNR